MAGAAVLSAMTLITSNGGPLIAGDLRIYPVLGVALMFFGVILRLRIPVIGLMRL